jgi:hypothetical protein
MDVAASDATLGQPVFGGDPRCPPPPAQDTTDLVLYATVEGSPPGPMPDTAWSGYKGRVLAALDRVAALPTELALPAFGIPFPLRGGGSARGRLAIAPTLSNVVGFTLDGRGALTSARVAASSLSPDADTTSLAMIQAAALAHSFPALPSGPGLADSVQLYLQIASIEPRPGTRAALLGQLEVPTWPLTRRATLPEDRPTAPPSPSGQRAASVDSITAEFVVDPAGHPAMNTVRIVGGRSVVNEGHSPPASVARFLQTLPVVQYEPALIGACRVPELVIQSFALPNAGGL